ncbi:hypothetical protein DL770_010676 [Monosporascus sp. CRB-9-2]|nr:hypothetical protein DL770_010676 [Monosporascus sp. CRB-9-2]
MVTANSSTVENSLVTSTDGSATIELPIVCYGMLENLPIAAIPTASVFDSPTLVHGFLSGDGTVHKSSDGSQVGKIDEKAQQCLFKLAEEEGVHIQFMLNNVDASGKYQGQKKRVIAVASAVVYGPEDLGDDIGDFLDKSGYCLQDPFGCELDVPYKNPHCLSTLFEEPPMTSGLLEPEYNRMTIFSVSDSLRTLQTSETLPEWKQPNAIKTELCRHQLQALWFFITRESSQNIGLIWQPKTLPNGLTTHMNQIDGSQRDVPPPLWSGGVLADEMGLVWSILTKTRKYGNSGSNSRRSAFAMVQKPLTGTPIQNSLTDLSGLLKFLKFNPYDDPSTLDEDIFDYIRREDPTEGIRRLKGLCRAIMIRRPSSIIGLPSRHDLTKTVDFSPQEKWWYQEIESSFQRPPDEAIEAHVGDGRIWMSAIQLINKLRLLCNLGLASKPATLTVPRRNVCSNTPEIDDSTEVIVASEFALGGTNCAECRNMISVPDTVDKAGSSPSAYYSECLQRARDGPTEDSSDGPVSSKVKAVVEEIQKALPEKSVVFSFWTTSLDMVQRGLDRVQIRYVRVDGTVDPARRQRALEQLQSVDDVKVILLTISCGGVGLDLTAASRVHLLEPQWNPAVEDQALARLHRMGQKRPVVTMRYIMRDSIEESVATAKGKKQLLAELLPRNQ